MGRIWPDYVDRVARFFEFIPGHPNVAEAAGITLTVVDKWRV